MDIHENVKDSKEIGTKSEKGRIDTIGEWCFLWFYVFIIVNIWKSQLNTVLMKFLSPAAFLNCWTMLIAGIIGYATIKWWLNERIYKKIQDKYKKGLKYISTLLIILLKTVILLLV